jgi:hypothetical protein
MSLEPSLLRSQKQMELFPSHLAKKMSTSIAKPLRIQTPPTSHKPPMSKVDVTFNSLTIIIQT